MLIVLIAVAMVAVAFRLRLARRLTIGGGILTLVFFLIHAVAEGTRWQMVPAYVLLAITILVLVWRAMRHPVAPDVLIKRGVVRKILSATVRFGLLPAAFLFVAFPPLAFPVFELPELPSWQQIGVRDLVVSFEDRPEIFTEDPNDHRELLVRVWYPGVVAEGRERERYFTATEAREVTKTLQETGPVPAFLNDHAVLVSTHAYRDIDLSPDEQRYPVLVFSHGYGSYVSQNTCLMEHLASLGYVVFSIAHTYDGSVVFPDGRVPGLGDHYTVWIREAMGNMEQVFAELGAFVKTTDQRERRRMLEGLQRQSLEDRERKLGAGLSWAVWLEDWNRFYGVLEELESGARPSIFENRLDLDRIGLFGMSFGGATAAEACHAYAGCRAAINIDGGHYFGIDSALYNAEISKPLLMIYASNYTTAPTPNEKNPDDFRALNDFHYESVATRGLRDDVIRLRIEGTSHTHLTDASLMMRYVPGMASGVPGERVAEILNHYCRAFFDHYVRGEERRSSLLDGPSPEFPEVTFQTFGHGFDERRPAEVTSVAPDAGVGSAATADGGVDGALVEDGGADGAPAIEDP